jgi:hypothetical protein
MFLFLINFANPKHQDLAHCPKFSIGSLTHIVSWGAVVGLTPNPQPGVPGLPFIRPLPYFLNGRAIAQAVSRWLPTAAARVWAWVWSCGILWWDKVAPGQVFSEYFGFPRQSSFHQLLHNHPHLSSGACTIGQKWPQYRDLVPPHLIIINTSEWHRCPYQELTPALAYLASWSGLADFPTTSRE